MLEMLRGLLNAVDAAIEDDRKPRMRGLEPVDATVVERRNLTVLARREPLEPGLARVHDERVDARALDRGGERLQRLLGILRVDADAALDGHRHAYPCLHCSDAVANQRRLGHQAGAEAPFLHAVRRAADIEVDLGEAEALTDCRTLRKRARIAAPELERDRLLGRIGGQKPRAIAMDHRAGRDHLAVEERASREQAMEEPTVPVGPVHHRRNTKPMSLIWLHFLVVSNR